MYRHKTLCLVIAILWMVMIFSLSSQVAHESNELSMIITKVIVKTVEKIIPDTDITIEKFNHLVRKNAHFFAYLILGALVISVLWKSNLVQSRKFSLLLAIGICVLYAISDEVHQMFVPGRGPQVRDVLIDSTGATIGIVIFMIFNKFRRKKQGI